MRLVGEKATLAAMPVPFRGRVCGLLLALSVMVRVPLRVPVVVGVKVTLITQLAPGMPPVPQSLVWEKFAEAAIFESASLPLVSTVSLMLWAALLVFTAWLLKLRLVGASTTVEVVPVPVIVPV